jgi:hypothetical protein
MRRAERPTRKWLSLIARFEQLDGIAGRIIDEDPLSSFSDYDLVAEPASWRRNSSTVADRSSTPIWIRSQPPGAGQPHDPQPAGGAFGSKRVLSRALAALGQATTAAGLSLV